MDLELNKGTFFVTTEDKTIKLGDGIPFIEEIELSASENLSHEYHLYNPPSVSFEVSSVDLTLLNDFCNMPRPNNKFIMNYQRDIMVQARWHKKARIRKKWLKRFGMKPDTVQVYADATVLEYHPGHVLNEQYSDSGICATFDSFNFETDKLEYIWRPDQKRRGLKIEW